MGAEICRAAQTAIGEPVTSLPAIEAYRRWAATYDQEPNALLALEERVLDGRIGPLEGRRFIDVGSGTGRWLARAQSLGARIAGFDLCHEMLRKSALAGHNAAADAAALPVRDGVADVTLCSFVLSYVPSLDAAVGEMARITRRGGMVIVSDLHPEAAQAGWVRSFRYGGQAYEIEHSQYSANELGAAARRSGLEAAWRLDARFGEPEREIFRRAGKEECFDTVCRTPAVLITAWIKR